MYVVTMSEDDRQCCYMELNANGCHSRDGFMPIYNGGYPAFMIYGTRAGGFSTEWIRDRDHLERFVDENAMWMRGPVCERCAECMHIVREISDSAPAPIRGHVYRGGFGDEDPELYKLVDDYKNNRDLHTQYKHGCKRVGVAPIERPSHPIESVRIAMFIGPVGDETTMRELRWPTCGRGLGRMYMRLAPCSMREQARIRREYFAPSAQRTSNETVNYFDRPRRYVDDRSPYVNAMQRLHFLERRRARVVEEYDDEELGEYD